MVLPPLEKYAYPLMATNPAARAVVIEAGDRWSVPSLPEEETIVLWGSPPRRSMFPLRTAAIFALRREKALYSIRGGRSGLIAHSVHRLAPPPSGSGALVGHLRKALIGGALVDLSPDGSVPRVLDAVADAAGLDAPPDRFHSPGDGGIVAVARRGGRRAVLRVGGVGTVADPSRVADGLELLRAARTPSVPELLLRGTAGEASWILESYLPGSRPHKIYDRVAEDVALFVDRLPVGDGPPTIPARELGIISARLPQYAPALDRLRSEIVGTIASLPSVMRHGDLWTANLLVDRGRLSGVVDWSAWDESGTPGTDLLHFVVSQISRSPGHKIGKVISERPWTSSNYRNASAPYWARLGVDPNDAVLAAVGVSWWAQMMAHALDRHPGRAHDERWIEANVTRVLDAISVI